MSYAIGHVIYGLKIDEALLERVKHHEPEAPVQYLEEIGFEVLRTAGGPPTGYFGVELDTVDEAGDVRVSTLKLEPTDEQSISVWTGLRALRDERGLEFSDDDVDVWLVWSNS